MFIYVNIHYSKYFVTLDLRTGLGIVQELFLLRK